MESTAPQGRNTNDIVLKSARGILIFAKWLLLLGIGVIAMVLPALPFLADQMVTAMAETFVTPPGTEIVWMVAGILVLGACIILLTLFAVNRLRRIVDSVAEGNPFTRINGTRLRGMGLAVLAIQIVTFFGSLLGTAMLTALGDTRPGQDLQIQIDGGLSLSGILLVLLLIILARVFDRGAEMREELEGTI